MRIEIGVLCSAAGAFPSDPAVRALVELLLARRALERCASYEGTVPEREAGAATPAS
jgi:hypothetical protein